MKNICPLILCITLFTSCLTAQKGSQISPEIGVREGYMLSIVQEDIKNPYHPNSSEIIKILRG